MSVGQFIRDPQGWGLIWVEHCDACLANPWCHRAPACPEGHGPEWVVLFLTDDDGVELWICIARCETGESCRVQFTAQEAVA